MFPQYEKRSDPIYIAGWSGIRQFPARFHKHMEILYVTSGSLRANIDGQIYDLHENELYIVFPNILHAIVQAEATGITLVVDHELFPMYNDMITRFKPETPVIRADRMPPAVSAGLQRVRVIHEQPIFTHKQATITGYITAIVGEILELTSLTPRNSDGDMVQKLIMYLLENYTQDISLEDTAQALNYSKCYISHLIMETFRCNYRTLLNSYRISLAQSLLLSSSKTVSEIAYECGFKNQSSFNRIFLKYSGETPSDFRNNHDGSVQKPMVYNR